MAWIADFHSPRVKRCAKRAIRLYMETWSATDETVRRILRSQGFSDVEIDAAFVICHITKD
jgi:hypothetical protein